MKLLSDNTSHTEEVKAKLVSTIQELVSEKRKVVIAHTNLSKVLKEFEHLQNVLQDSKKLKSGVLNICNKVIFFGKLQKYIIIIIFSTSQQDLMHMNTRKIQSTMSLSDKKNIWKELSHHKSIN